jgi:hypothetical protein
MRQFIRFPILISLALLFACAGPAPAPEPGMKILHHGWGEEMQVAVDVDWSKYSKVILHEAPVEFMDNWRRNQERLHGKQLRDSDVERIRTTVADQFAEVMFEALSEKGEYELTSDSGPGVMSFQPNITDVNVVASGLVQNSILESMPDSRGRMTIELVIRDAVTDKVLAVAWQKQSDPREGDMEMTLSVSNALAFKLMSKSWTNWLLGQLDKARSAS